MLRRLCVVGTSLVILAAMGAAAFAHPGHGVTPPDEPAHWLEPVHFVPVVLVGLGIAAVAWRRSHRNS